MARVFRLYISLFTRTVFFLRPEEHGVNLIMGLFDIWISQLFQKLVKCGVVLGRDLDADEDFADVYQRNVLAFNTSSSEKRRGRTGTVVSVMEHGDIPFDLHTF